ncbi:MAG: hypothetical protein F6J98_37630 [Moorea sp. SIO4G2]|uniref:hypothetical protein n=1 Tax=unclassified Moorena TaxID=2683338 RepID=UPI0013F935B3|nr:MULTISPECIES: hypothetical protein [unclassified Moorena]NEO16851.1 hypothetical protein [Moorena sp. SIO3E8]NEO65812.1 hypothetical protein [Moorena sp. SIO4G2]NEQ00347.1 hypothetical protein [Moorena sp. SIO3F7]
MQSLMGETTAVAHGGNPQDRAASPRPRCIAINKDLTMHLHSPLTSIGSTINRFRLRGIPAD